MSFIRNAYKKYMKSVVQDVETVPDVEQWKQLMQNLPTPVDNIDLSYNKHLCRVSYFSAGKKLMLNLLSAGGLLLALPKLCKRHKPLPAVDNNAILLIKDLRIDYRDVIPQDLLPRFDQVIEVDRKDLPVGLLCAEAWEIFRRCLRKHPFSFWFNLLILKELSAHSHYLLNHNVKAGAAYVIESNIVYPLVTELYETTGRSFISFMHGEYLLQIILAFMKFSEYHVWSEDYVDMFTKDLHCQIGEYKVYTPLKLQKKWNLELTEPEYFCTYYFSGESRETIHKVADIFGKLEANGMKCKVRPHPRATEHVKEIFSTFAGIKVEMPGEVSMQESLAQTKYAVGLVSTVLSEAYVEGREIVIDDMGDPKQFESLSARKAAVLSKKHLLLSELCESVSQDTNWSA